MQGDDEEMTHLRSQQQQRLAAAIKRNAAGGSSGRLAAAGGVRGEAAVAAAAAGVMEALQEATARAAARHKQLSGNFKRTSDNLVGALEEAERIRVSAGLSDVDLMTDLDTQLGSNCMHTCAYAALFPAPVCLDLV
jgi:hypothetical protein